MQDIIFSFNLLTIGLLSLLIFSIYVLILRKQIYYWFDPLLIFVFFNSISIAFVFYLYFFKEEIKPVYFWTFCIAVVSFIIGLKTGAFGGLPENRKGLDTKFNKDRASDYSLIVDIFLVITLIVLVGSNLIMLLVKGTLPIFSANPSEAKITLYTGGWGLIRRINYALSNFALAIPIIKIFHPYFRYSQKKRFLYVFAFFICVMVLITMGSKSTLLILINIIFAVILVNRTFATSTFKLSHSLRSLKSINKYIKYAFFTAVFYMGFVILQSSIETTASDALITRLVASGDAFYFFYVYDLGPVFKRGVIDYIPHILNPILGMFRIADYEYPIGTYLLNYSIGLPLDAFSAFGPNAQYPIEGYIYFGKFGLPFYSFGLGYLISWIRVKYLKRIGPFPNFLQILVYVILSSIIVTAATDFPLFLTIFYDCVIFGSIVIFLSMIISECFSKPVFRKYED